MSDLPPDRATPTLTWRVAPHVVWTQFDDSDSWVAYNQDSADLHLLTSAARTLWTLIEDAEHQNLQELTNAFAAALGRAADDEWAAATREVLISMDRAGLIGPVTS